MKKFLCVLLSLLMVIGTVPTVFATDTGEQAPLRIDITTDKTSYGTYGEAKVTVTITNTSDQTIENISAKSDLDGLTRTKGQTEASKASLNAGESFSYSYKVMLGDSSNLNFFQKIWHWIVKIFRTMFSGKNGGATIDKSRDFVQETKSIKFGKVMGANTVKVWFGVFIDLDDETIFTRGQWIQLLTEKMNLSLIENIADFDRFYADSMSSQYGAAIETAQAHGILPPIDTEQDMPLFQPDEIATREFGAYTAVKAIGFFGEADLSCSDSANIKYPTEVAIAINESLFILNDGRFLPDKPITDTDKSRIFLQYDNWQEFNNINENSYRSDIEYKNNVLDLGELTIYSISESEGTYTVILPKNSDTATITIGNIILLPANDSFPSGIAIKVSDVSNNGSNYTVIGYQAEIDEVFSEVDFIGEATFNPNGVEVEEGVVAEPIPLDDDNIQTSGRTEDISAFGVNGIQARGIDISVSAGMKFKIDKKISSHTKIKGELSFLLPDVQVKLKGGLKIDWIPFEIREFVFKIKEEAKFNLNFEVSGKTPTNGKYRLGKLPFALGPTGAFVNVNVYLVVEFSGEIGIEFSVSATQGFSYKKGHNLVGIHEYDANIDWLKVDGKFEAGVAPSASLEWLNFMFLEITVASGLKFKATWKPLSTQNCIDVKLSVYLKASASEGDSLFAKTLQKLKCTITAEIAWELGNWHFENFKRVKKCIEDINIPDDATEFNGHYYKVIETSLTWEDAKDYCENVLGGHLATITSQEEQEFIVQLISHYPATPTNHDFWLGGKHTGKSWEWITGENMNYTNFATENANANAFLGIRNFDKKWYDMATGRGFNNLGGGCGSGTNYPSELYFICEWDNLNIKADNLTTTSMISAQSNHTVGLKNDKIVDNDNKYTQLNIANRNNFVEKLSVGANINVEYKVYSLSNIIAVSTGELYSKLKIKLDQYQCSEKYFRLKFKSKYNLMPIKLVA